MSLTAGNIGVSESFSKFSLSNNVTNRFSDKIEWTGFQMKPLNYRSPWYKVESTSLASLQQSLDCLSSYSPEDEVC